MSRPQDVRVLRIQDRRASARSKRPWIARWKVDGQPRSRAFRTQAEADRFRISLLEAVRYGEHFDEVTGEPESWQPAEGEDLRVYGWARRWLADQWPEWAPRTRTSAVEAIARFVLAATDAKPRDVDAMRSYLRGVLPPEGAPIVEAHERWLDAHSLELTALSRARTAEIERDLGTKIDGRPLAASTAARYRKVTHACVNEAVQREYLTADPWPPRSRARSQRKAVRVPKKIDVRAMPDPATMARAIDAIVSHQPGSKKYRVMTAVAYYGGLRPSEVVMLRKRCLALPDGRWGRIDVTEADIDFDEPGEPKTGPRTVPIPPVLVGILQSWVAANEQLGDDDLIFRTRNDKRPTQSNWARAWQRALTSIGYPKLRVYDCRHAAATTWLRAGVPLAEVARRLGHSVETLVSTYVGALPDDEAIGNQRIEAALLQQRNGYDPGHRRDEPTGQAGLRGFSSTGC